MPLWNMPKPSKRPPMSEIITFKPPKKYIATVAEFYTDDLDKKVNDLIDNGYTLIKREVITPNNDLEKSYFYAELEKVVFD